MFLLLVVDIIVFLVGLDRQHLHVPAVNSVFRLRTRSACGAWPGECAFSFWPNAMARAGELVLGFSGELASACAGELLFSFTGVLHCGSSSASFFSSVGVETTSSSSNTSSSTSTIAIAKLAIDTKICYLPTTCLLLIHRFAWPARACMAAGRPNPLKAWGAFVDT